MITLRACTNVSIYFRVFGFRRSFLLKEAQEALEMVYQDKADVAEILRQS